MAKIKKINNDELVDVLLNSKTTRFKVNTDYNIRSIDVNVPMSLITSNNGLYNHCMSLYNIPNYEKIGLLRPDDDINISKYFTLKNLNSYYKLIYYDHEICTIESLLNNIDPIKHEAVLKNVFLNSLSNCEKLHFAAIIARRIKLSNKDIAKFFIKCSEANIYYGYELNITVSEFNKIIVAQKFKEYDIDEIFNSLIKSFNYSIKHREQNYDLLIILILLASKSKNMYDFVSMINLGKFTTHENFKNNCIFENAILGCLNVKDLDQIHKYGLMRIIGSKSISHLNKRNKKLIATYAKKYPKSKLTLKYNNYIIGEIL